MRRPATGLAERAAARLIEGGWSDVVGPGRRRRGLGRGRAIRSIAACTCRARPLPRSSSTNTARRGSAPRNWPSARSAASSSRSSTAAPTRSTTRTASPGRSACPAPSWSTAFDELVPSPDTFVVVNCGGRTRSIIGAQALIDAGVPNRVVSLKDGTMAWHLAGLEVVAGADRRRARGLGRGRRRGATARRGGGAALWRAGHRPCHPRRNGSARPTGARSMCWTSAIPAEYRAGHLPGSLMAPGGQLVQETDSWLGVWGARVVLVDDTGVRARMTASWLRRMGWDAAVLDGGLEGVALETRCADSTSSMFPLAGPEPATISPAELQANRRRGRCRSGAEPALPRGPHSGRLVRDPRPPRRGARQTAGGRRSGADQRGWRDRPLRRRRDRRTRRPVKVLAGGTAAWKAAGLPLETGMTQTRRRARRRLAVGARRPADRERYMREYLAWEIDLVNQIARDADCRFRLAAA